MGDDDRLRAELRRSLGNEPRRAGPLVGAWRWRVELLAFFGLLTCAVVFGLRPALVATTFLVLTVLGACHVLPVVATVVTGLLQRVVVPHRLRSGLVHSGLTNRRGRVAWILPARSSSWDVVVVTLWLPAGVSGGDVDNAREDLATACGALDVTVQTTSARRDRATVHVVRPRWGMPGR